MSPVLENNLDGEKNLLKLNNINSKSTSKIQEMRIEE
jgi:hypothetical protein